MKNSLNLVLIVLLLAALGCTCPKLSELSKKASSTPVPSVSPSSSNTPPSSRSGDDVSMEKYERIKVGMKRSEVESIMGSKGEETYSGEGGGITFVSLKWVGEGYRSIFVSFRSDKVTSKSQVGLKK